MVHVGMGEKQIGIEQIPLLNHNLFAKQAYARACIDDDPLRTTGYFKASGISAIFDGIGTRARYASPCTPKLELE
jgi:hypothetical protein